MPTYTYRREDGTTFDIRQKFSDDPLEIDPETGQKVHRVPQASGIIFKGSGFYVTDTKGASSTTTPPSSNGNGKTDGDASSSDSSSAKTEATTTTSSSDAAD